MFAKIGRILKFSVQDILRNFWLSLVTVTLLVLALLSINLLIVFNVITNEAISSVEESIDVTAYFSPEISEDQVLNVKARLTTLSEVSEITYLSKDDALEEFRAKHEDNEHIIQSLDELEVNPLGATLIIKAHDTSDYPEILSELEDPNYAQLIDDTSFDDHRSVIGRINTLTDRVNSGVATVALIFVIISALIIFNTIRVAIYTHRDEIKAMKLVGATNAFVKAPFLVEGIIFSIIALTITIAVLYPFLGLIQPFITDLFDSSEFSILAYFDSQFIQIFGWQLLGVIILSIISSHLAVGKYVRV